MCVCMHVSAVQDGMHKCYAKQCGMCMRTSILGGYIAWVHIHVRMHCWTEREGRGTTCSSIQSWSYSIYGEWFCQWPLKMRAKHSKNVNPLLATCRFVTHTHTHTNTQSKYRHTRAHVPCVNN